MCLSLALGVMSAATSLVSQTAAMEQQNKTHYLNAEIANTDAIEKYAQNQLQKVQEEQKAAETRFNTEVNMRRSRGTALASTQNSGLSTEAVLRDIERQGGREEAATSATLKNAQEQADANAKTIHNEADARIKSVPAGEKPSLVAAAIAGLGTALSAEASSGSSKLFKDRGGSMT